MSYAGLLTQTATIKHHSHSTEVDAYNMPVISESSTAVPTYVSSPSATEVGVVALGMHRAHFLSDVVIDATDLVVVDGVTFEVVGIPREKWNPRTGSLHHITVDLVEVAD